jgi:Uma2 family endonuclease
MNQPDFKTPLSVEAYLEGELHAEVRHEYLAGEVYAMTGASRPHNIIAGNLFTVLHAHLRGGPCRVFMSDMKLRLRHGRDDYFYYPDLMVACRPEDSARYWCEQPKLIVEVLSGSTERIDSREKLFAYQNIEALEEYVLLAQDKREATVYRRAEGWSAVRPGGEDLLEMASVGLSVALEQIYEGAGA